MDMIENECALARLIWGIIKTNKGQQRLLFHDQIMFTRADRISLQASDDLKIHCLLHGLLEACNETI